jgi:hypothetical protein
MVTQTDANQQIQQTRNEIAQQQSALQSQANLAGTAQQMRFTSTPLQSMLYRKQIAEAQKQTQMASADYERQVTAYQQGNISQPTQEQINDYITKRLAELEAQRRDYRIKKAAHQLSDNEIRVKYGAVNDEINLWTSFKKFRKSDQLKLFNAKYSEAAVILRNRGHVQVARDEQKASGLPQGTARYTLDTGETVILPKQNTQEYLQNYLGAAYEKAANVPKEIDLFSNVTTGPNITQPKELIWTLEGKPIISVKQNIFQTTLTNVGLFFSTKVSPKIQNFLKSDIYAKQIAPRVEAIKWVTQPFTSYAQKKQKESFEGGGWKYPSDIMVEKKAYPTKGLKGTAEKEFPNIPISEMSKRLEKITPVGQAYTQELNAGAFNLQSKGITDLKSKEYKQLSDDLQKKYEERMSRELTGPRILDIGYQIPGAYIGGLALGAPMAALSLKAAGTTKAIGIFGGVATAIGLGFKAPQIIKEFKYSTGAGFRELGVSAAEVAGPMAFGFLGAKQGAEQFLKTGKIVNEVNFIKVAEEPRPLVKLNEGIFQASSKENVHQGVEAIGLQTVRYETPWPLRLIGGKKFKGATFDVTRAIHIPYASTAFGETGNTGLLTVKALRETPVYQDTFLAKTTYQPLTTEELKESPLIKFYGNEEIANLIRYKFWSSSSAKELAIAEPSGFSVSRKPEEYLTFLQARKPVEYTNLFGGKVKLIQPEELPSTTGIILPYSSEYVFGTRMGNVGEEVTSPFAVTYPRKLITPLVEKQFDNEFLQLGYRTYNTKNFDSLAYPYKSFIQYSPEKVEITGFGETKTPLIDYLLKKPTQENFADLIKIPRGEPGNMAWKDVMNIPSGRQLRAMSSFDNIPISAEDFNYNQIRAGGLGMEVSKLFGSVPLPTTYQPLFPLLKPISTFKPIEIPKTIPKVYPNLKPMSIPSLTPKISPKTTPIVMPKVIPITTPALTPKLTPILTPKLTPILVPKLTPKLTPQLVPKLTPQLTPKITPNITPIITPNLSFGFNQKKKKGKIAKAFKTFVKRRGKYRELSGIFAKGEAIRRGEQAAMTTLAASFKVTPTKGFVEGFETSRIPPSNIFRAYKIRGQARQALKDEWIQKAGTRKEGMTIRGARLAAHGERLELMAARKQSMKKQKLNNSIINFRRKNATKKSFSLW